MTIAATRRLLWRVLLLLALTPAGGKRVLHWQPHGAAQRATRSNFFSLARQHARELVPTLDARALGMLMDARDNDTRVTAHERCAVVGSSAILLGAPFGCAWGFLCACRIDCRFCFWVSCLPLLNNSTGAHHGKRIDRADYVVRCNFAPVTGYESDVGSRTDAMVVGSASSLESHRGPWSLADFAPDIDVFLRIQPLGAYRSTLGRALDELAHNLKHYRHKSRAQVHMFSPLFERAANHVLHSVARSRYDGATNIFGQQYKPTSGFRAFLLALLTCQRVDVYGFGAHRLYGDGHYFDSEQEVLENPGHNYSIEQDTMASFSVEKPREQRARLCESYFRAPILPPFRCADVHMHRENAVDDFQPLAHNHDAAGAHAASQRDLVLAKKWRKLKAKELLAAEQQQSLNASSAKPRLDEQWRTANDEQPSLSASAKQRLYEQSIRKVEADGAIALAAEIAALRAAFASSASASQTESDNWWIMR